MNAVLSESKSQRPAHLDGDAQLVFQALNKVERWVEDHNYEAYKPFDGLSSSLRPLTFKSNCSSGFSSRPFNNVRSTFGPSWA